MRKSTQTLTTQLCAVCVWAALAASATPAQTTTFTYQGKLTDAGQPANGVFDLQFALFDVLSGGTPLGAPLVREDVVVTGGVFTVPLDFGAGAFPGAARFLELAVRPGASTGAFTLLAPRQPVQSTPYALRSLNAGNADNAAQLGGVAAANYLQTVARDATLSGNGTAGSALGIAASGVGTAQLANEAVTNAKIAAGQVVKSLNGLTDNVTLAAGANVTLTPAGNTLTIAAPNAAPSWALSGNAGTNPATNFLGTTDNQPLVFRANGAELMRLSANGNLGLGTTNPLERLAIVGNASLTGALDSLGQSSKLRFHYDTLAGLPSAATYHGMFAHVHAEGKGYFAHAGAWVPLANEVHTHAAADIATGILGTVRGGTGLGAAGAAGNYLRSDGANWTSAALQAADLPAGSGNYIQNSATPQVASNFNLSGNGIIGGNFGVGTLANLASFSVASNTAGAFNNTAYFEAPLIGPHVSNIHFGTTGDWFIRSAAATGKVILQDTGGNVGLGVSIPIAKLSVQTSTASAGNNTAYFAAPLIGPHVSNIHFGTTGDWFIRSAAATGKVILQDFGGNVGIGTSNPVAKLGVTTTTTSAGNNTAYFEAPNLGPHVSNIHFGTTGDWFIRSAAATGKVILQDTGGNTGIGTASPNHKLRISGGPPWTSGMLTGSVELDNQGFIGWHANSLGNRFGLGQFNGGFVIIATASDPGTMGSAANSMMLIDDSGRVGINTLSPDQRLTVNGGASKPAGGSWAVFSDERLKNIKGRYTTGLQAVLQLQPLRYAYKPGNALKLETAQEHIGFGAQTLQRILPEAVSRNDQGYLLVNNDPILWTMLNAIKEQQAQLNQQQEQIKAQQQELAALKQAFCAARPQARLCPARRSRLTK